MTQKSSSQVIFCIPNSWIFHLFLLPIVALKNTIIGLIIPPCYVRVVMLSNKLLHLFSWSQTHPSPIQSNAGVVPHCPQRAKSSSGTTCHSAPPPSGQVATETWWIPVGFFLADMGVSKSRGIPKWMVKIRENPIRIDDLGGKPTIFWKHPYTSDKICWKKWNWTYIRFKSHSLRNWFSTKSTLATTCNLNFCILHCLLFLGVYQS